MREFWAAAFGRVFYWAVTAKKFEHRVLLIARLMDLSINEVFGKAVISTFRFRASKDVLDFLKHACLDYGRHGADYDAAAVFIRRCVSAWGQELPPLWPVGAVHVFHFLTLSASLATLLHRVGQAKKSDIGIGNPVSLSVSEDAFRELERMPQEIQQLPTTQ